jgi:hypothetical protein
MNFPKLPRSLVLAALSLSLAAGLRADGPAEATLRDHVDATVPAHLTIERLQLRLVGSPATKAKAELTLRAAETLYVETAKAPEVKPIAAELTPDLRQQEPKALRILKVSTPEGAVTKPLNFDFSVTAGGNGLGQIDGKKLLVFGLPRAEFPADAVTADTAEGRAAITAWEKAVADYNVKLKTHESRVRTDRNKDTARELINHGLQVLDRVHGNPGPAAGGIGKLLENRIAAPVNAATNAAAPASTKAIGETKEAAGDALKRFGGLLGAFGSR